MFKKRCRGNSRSPVIKGRGRKREEQQRTNRPTLLRLKSEPRHRPDPACTETPGVGADKRPARTASPPPRRSRGLGTHDQGLARRQISPQRNRYRRHDRAPPRHVRGPRRRCTAPPHKRRGFRQTRQRGQVTTRPGPRRQDEKVHPASCGKRGDRFGIVLNRRYHVLDQGPQYGLRDVKWRRCAMPYEEQEHSICVLLQEPPQPKVSKA
ncbi:hypothetical protein BU26DRAFT_4685 [Trematosphaeria pertusa]|uniref:Uncharacterized protein n=1 Tax=Trematosphaeria pertusa TaxID=390896 RepID=A0A6A6J174_9PLEO|nr:uncharacterized protein BU26DRAFT_4685 [Trematosphaeria pertusa]KAF2255630.1 hypothetical protein BU26DRAFT_4685 [Trematosphaeria pertusa]